MPTADPRDDLGPAQPQISHPKTSTRPKLSPRARSIPELYDSDGFSQGQRAKIPPPNPSTSHEHVRAEHRKRFFPANGICIQGHTSSLIRGPMNICDPKDFSAEPPNSPGLFVKVTLDHSKGQIWRTLLVPANAHLGWIHAVIQVAMGWSNSHLHQFTFKDKTFSDPRFDLYDPMTIDERKCTLDKLLTNPGNCVRYEYDFGDNWQHTLSLIKTGLTALPELATCVDGAGACPPEDCGGIAGYRELLKAMKEPDSKAAIEFTEWLGYPYDRHHFDANTVNSSLQKLPWPSVSESALRRVLSGRLKRRRRGPKPLRGAAA